MPKHDADNAENESRLVMHALCRALGWDIQTDNDGNYVIYPGICDPDCDEEQES